MTDKEIIERAKDAEKRTRFGELVHSPISKGINSAYGIGFVEGMVEYRNSLQEEPVSIWHDGCEIPKSGTNILMIRKDEEDSNYPPIAGCFHGTNYRLDGKNWGYYNGFCYNEIEPPVKWTYIDDILNLSNVERTIKNWKEDPVSIDFEQELYKAFGQVKDFTLGMQIAKWFYEMGKNSQEPVSEELEEEIERYLKESLAVKFPTTNIESIKADIRYIARHFANWQKNKMMKDAMDGIITESAGGDGWVNVMTGFVKSKDVNVKFGDKIKIIVVKED